MGFILGCQKEPPTEAEILATAQAQADAGSYDVAAATLESYLQEHPGAFDVIDALAFTYSYAGDPAMAAFYFRRAAEVDPAQPEYLLYAAEALERSDDFAGAADAYRNYLTARPGDSGVHIKLGDLNAELGNRSAALDAYLQANRAQPSGAVQVAIGRLYLQGDNRAQAQTWFASAAQSDDGARRDALLGLLEVALRAERWADAENLVAVIDDEYPKALDASPLASSRGELARWRQSQEDAAAAVAALNPPASPSADQPASPAPFSPDGRPEPESRTARRDSAAVGAGPVPVGAAPVATPLPEEETADDTDTDLSGPPVDKQQMVDSVLGDPAEITEVAELFPAREEARPGRDSAPARTLPATPATSYEGLLRQARSQAAAGDYQPAIRSFHRALARQSDDPEVWLELSEAQFQAGEDLLAPASASEAVRRAPDEPVYLLQYLRVAQRTLPQSRVVRELEAARQRFPEHPEVALALARVYEEQNNPRYANQMYRIFLRLAGPNHPERPAVEAQLGG